MLPAPAARSRSPSRQRPAARARPRLSITDNAGTSSAATQTASLTGIGEAPATDTLSAFALTFAQQQIGTTSGAQTITLTNSGGVPLTLIAASVSPGDFSVVNACGNSLAAHATCALNVIFSPTAVGARTATLTITDQFRYQNVALSGTGIAGPGVSLTPVSLVYPATGVGLTALAQTLTLTNNGGVPLTVSKVAVSPGFAIALNSCTTTLAVNATCSLTIVFAPTAPGPIAGTLTFADNAGSGVQTTSLSGTGIDFALTAAGVTSATIAGSGASVTYALQLSSLSGLSGNVALSCTGAPVNSICTVTPSIGALGTTAPVVVTLETAVPSAVGLVRTLPALALHPAQPRPFCWPCCCQPPSSNGGAIPDSHVSSSCSALSECLAAVAPAARFPRREPREAVERPHLPALPRLRSARRRLGSRAPSALR